jgi:hypothetical protein
MNNTSKISQLKTIRIRNEVAEYFRGKPLNKLVEWLYEKIKDGEISVEDDGIYIIYKYNMRTFEKVCRKLKVDPVSMYRTVIKGLNREAEKMEENA